MKIVLAYSGGLDTSVAISWLKTTYKAEVIAFCADLGQGEELGGLGRRAKKAGASKLYIEDLREEFVRDFLFPMLRANAVYEGAYLLGTSVARPLIAKKLIEIADKEGAEGVAHGATGKGNDQVRFELSCYSLRPDIKIIAPWRQWPFKSRRDLIEYASAHGIPVAATREKPYSTDRNIFHISYEGGVLEDPWAAPPPDMYTLALPPEKAKDRPEYVEVEYENGNPTGVNGKKKLSPLEIMVSLNRIAGRNGVGRVDLVENRYVGMKSRGVYETPGGTVLHAAHRAVESITLDREALHMRDALIPRYAGMVYNGFWFSPERELLQNLMDNCQRNVTGTARLKLYKGGCLAVGRKSPASLYSTELATFEEEAVYDQKDAEGFIKLNALRLRVESEKQKSRNGKSRRGKK